MAQTQDGTLEKRIYDLEAAVRSLVTAAAVGGTSVAATTPGTVTLTGTAGTAGGVGWDMGQGPSVDLFLGGGRLRVDVGAALEVYGNRCSLYVGYEIRGPVVDPELEDLAAAPVVRAPSYEAAASLQDDGAGINQLGSFSTFDVVTGLEPGWYRVRTAYALTYSGTTGAPYGIASYRRLAVTRY